MLSLVLSAQLVLNSLLQCPVFHKIVSLLLPFLLLPQHLRFRYLLQRVTYGLTPLRQRRISTVDCSFPGGAAQPLDDCRDGAMPDTAVL